MKLIRRAREVWREEGCVGSIAASARYVNWKIYTRIRKPTYDLFSHMAERTPIGRSLANIAVGRVRRHIPTITGVDDAIDFAWSFRSLGVRIRPIQFKEEVAGLLKILAPRSLRFILEIGTGVGGTLFLFTQIANPDATIVTVALPRELPEWRIPLYESFAKSPTQRIVVVRGDSHSTETREKIQSIIGERNLDFLFIDGDHAYESVKKDFETYSPLVKPSGLIALHDIVEHPAEAHCEVNHYWNQIKDQYNSVEIIANPKQRFCGIGILTSKVPERPV